MLSIIVEVVSVNRVGGMINGKRGWEYESLIKYIMPWLSWQLTRFMLYSSNKKWSDLSEVIFLINLSNLLIDKCMSRPGALLISLTSFLRWWTTDN